MEDGGQHAQPTAGEPASETLYPWLYAYRLTGEYPPPAPDSGKWLLFVKRFEVNRRWAQIKQATEAGLLGHMARVSTIARGEGHHKHAILVWTYSGQDEQDVQRVRQALREMGFTWALRYKLDSDTRAGRFGEGYVPLYHE